ncbi:MAG: hypothetical protein IT210_20705 [Armatimonadetes bacterium]|nr:hypothetical protein [Armatimonadota bacterium]
MPASAAPERVALKNRHVMRVLENVDGLWRTVRFARADGSDALEARSDEAGILLMDGTSLSLADYRAEKAPRFLKTTGQQSLVIEYVPRRSLPASAPRRIRAEYLLRDRDPYIRKSLILTMGEGRAVDRLEVERFRTQAECDRGGRGEPVFVGPSWFFGLEYPGSETSHREGQVALTHFPGLAKRDSAGQWAIHSRTSVAGVGRRGDPLALAFRDYLETIRRPRRNLLPYNSWYDWHGDDLTIPNLISTFEAFRQNLLLPYRMKMDAFVPDDGWQDYDSIWIPRANLYPKGLEPLRRMLEAKGTRLGIWMPLNGTNLNIEWGVRQGYEKPGQGNFYCLAAPHYNRAIREATRQLISQGRLAYYKHDFNHLQCSAEGHGHLPTARHGHEANLDAKLELLAYQRRLQPDVFLNITSFAWYSPWWLQHANSIWMNAEGGTGFNTSFLPGNGP